MIDKKQFKKKFALPLKKAGYINKGQTWYLNGEDALVVVNLEKIDFFSNNQYVINVGIWLNAFGVADFPQYNHCHLYYRAERFFPQDRELILNSCSLELSSIQLLSQFIEFMEDKLLPFLKELTNEHNLRRLMAQGVLDRGLVRIEAREYLTSN